MLNLFRKEYLPYDNFINIIMHLDIDAIKSLLRTYNKQIYYVCQCKHIWQRLLDITFNLQYLEDDAMNIYVGLYKVSKYNQYPPTYPEFKKIIKNRDIRLIKLIVSGENNNKLYNLLINETINMDDTEIAEILLKFLNPRYKNNNVIKNAVRMSIIIIIDVLIHEHGYLLSDIMILSVQYQNYDVMYHLIYTYDICDKIICDILFALFHRTRNIFSENYYRMIYLALKYSVSAKILFNSKYNVAGIGVQYNNIRILNIALKIQIYSKQ